MINNSDSGTIPSWQPSVPCPRNELGLIPVTKPRTSGQVCEAEVAALVKAYSDGNAELAARHPDLATACGVVVRTHRAAESAIDRLTTFVSIGSAADARARHEQIIERHTDDGPEDRRRVLSWARWMFWPVVVLSGVFEGVYLAKIFQQLLDVGPGSFLYWTSYVPAVGLTICLLVVGATLAQTVFRHRSRVERRNKRGELGIGILLRRLWKWRDTGELGHDDLPWPSWPLPMLFAIAVFTMLASWAQIRAMLAAVDNETLAPYEPYAAGMLILLASGVVVLKFLAHNPYADSAQEAAKLLAQAQSKAAALVEAARDLTTKHYQSWLELEAYLAGAQAKAKRIVEEAVIRLREERARSGQASEVQPPGQPVTSDERSVLSRTHPGVVNLRLELSVFSYGRDVSNHYRPRELEQKLENATIALGKQFQLTRASAISAAEKRTR